MIQAHTFLLYGHQVQTYFQKTYSTIVKCSERFMFSIVKGLWCLRWEFPNLKIWYNLWICANQLFVEMSTSDQIKNSSQSPQKKCNSQESGELYNGEMTCFSHSSLPEQASDTIHGTILVSNSRDLRALVHTITVSTCDKYFSQLCKRTNTWNRYRVEQQPGGAFHSMGHIFKLMRWAYSKFLQWFIFCLSAYKIINSVLDQAAALKHIYYITSFAGICWPWIQRMPD